MTPWWNKDGKYFNDWFLKDMEYDHGLITVTAQVDFIERVLAPAKDAHILDVACGTGRTCLELARRGYVNITGVDINKILLGRARCNAENENESITFVEKDMRDLSEFSGRFDVVLCVGTSIGYFDDEEENRLTIAGMANSLCPGGTLLFEVWHIHPDCETLYTRGEILSDGTRITVTTYFNEETKRAHAVLANKDNEEDFVNISYRSYEPAELQKICADYGLLPDKPRYLHYWTWKNLPKEKDFARRVVVTAQKPNC